MTVALPPGLEIYEAVPLHGWRAAALTLDGNAARLLVADMAAGTVVADVPLPGIAIVSYNPPTTLDPGETPVLPMALPGLGWDVDRDRLYIAHADSDRITVIDLSAGEVVAEADRAGGVYREGAAKWAEVSPDGSCLYVTGHRSEVDRSGSPPSPLSGCW